VVRLAKQFPQLGLHGDKLEVLKTEAIDFFMTDPAELLDCQDMNAFWAAVHEIKQMGYTLPQCSNLLVLVRAHSALPASNKEVSQ